ncbi:MULTISPECIES: class I SAM-dependent methyltransferase [Paenibacillus]|uniref:class I SAM-dependent methyltransferase n=1 Tax=Paenibacillus TaxID=44249 RepID=UPI00073F8F56|nr:MULTISPECIES: class I SAM-dependent methyltransferase [Paenibacillus]MDU4697449.1 class I SAM-dependent methyltransferase [Paenibacillus sp.]
MVNNDRVNERYYGLVNTVKSHEATRARIHWICRHVSGHRMLDVGCSQGITSILLGREGRRVVGVDVEEEAIQYAQKELSRESGPVRSKVQFKVADVTELPGQQRFDTVILGQILEHFANPALLLTHAYRLLADGGTLVVTVPYGFHPFHDHKQTFYAGNFGNCLDPWFEILQMELQHNYLCCVAVKRKEVRANALPNASLMKQWIEFDSERFVEIERQHLQSMEQRKKALEQAYEQLKELRKTKPK